jgi:hypothetical protein
MPDCSLIADVHTPVRRRSISEINRNGVKDFRHRWIRHNSVSNSGHGCGVSVGDFQATGSTCERVYRRRNVAGMDLWSSGSVQRAYVPSCEPPPHTSRAIIVLNPRRERHKPKVELGVSLPKGSRVPLFSPVCNHGWESTTICVHHEIAALSSSGSRERTNRLPIFTPQSQDATPKKQKNTSVPNVQLAIGKPCGSTSV